jgi:hypothetical protein
MTFELKCEGLTVEQLATRSVPAVDHVPCPGRSTLTT